MRNTFSVKPIVNKKNGQINFSIPKRKLSKKSVKKIYKSSKLKFKLMRIWD